MWKSNCLNISKFAEKIISKSFLPLTKILWPAKKKASEFSGIGVVDFSNKNSAEPVEMPCRWRKGSRHSISFRPGTASILKQIFSKWFKTLNYYKLCRARVSPILPTIPILLIFILNCRTVQVHRDVFRCANTVCGNRRSPFWLAIQRAFWHIGMWQHIEQAGRRVIGTFEATNGNGAGS